MLAICVNHMLHNTELRQGDMVKGLQALKFSAGHIA